MALQGACQCQIGLRQISQSLIDRAEFQIRFQIARVVLANGLPAHTRPFHILFLQLRARNQAQTLHLPLEPSGFGSEQSQISRERFRARNRYVLLEAAWNRPENAWILGFQAREQPEYGTVQSVGCQAVANPRDQCILARGEMLGVITQITIGQQIERRVVYRGSNQESPLITQCMPDAQLIEDIGVVDGHIRDDQIRRQKQMEHVLANIARRYDFSCSPTADAERVQGRRDQIALDCFKSMPFFTPKGRTINALMQFHCLLR